MLVCARYAYAVGKKAKSHIQIDIYICLRKKTVGRRGDSGMNNRCDTTQRKEREIERESKDYGNIEFFHLAKCKEYYLFPPQFCIHIFLLLLLLPLLQFNPMFSFFHLAIGVILLVVGLVTGVARKKPPSYAGKTLMVDGMRTKK